MTAAQFDITPADADYTGPAIHLSWQNSAAVARADDPRCDPWILVPAALLGRLASAAEDSDAAVAQAARELLRESRLLLRAVPAEGKQS
jgi:hypothetical protein